MNIDLLRDILVKSKILVKETSRNFQCRCFICGDHPNPSKQGHLYVSKDESLPVSNCFYNHCKTNINRLVFHLTSDERIAESVISKKEIETLSKQTKIIVHRDTIPKIEIPKLDLNKYPEKTEYIKSRTNNLYDFENSDNLIFDFNEFIFSNNLQDSVLHQLEDWEYNLVRDNSVAFISRNKSRIFCRMIRDDLPIKFRKIFLFDSRYGFLPYVSFRGGNKNSDLIVLAEGTFTLLGEYCHDTLDIKKDCRIYAAGQSFSYPGLLKSICYDESLYQCKVIILSDIDKTIRKYFNFFKSSDHCFSKCNIYYNENKKDFGEFPIKPYLVSHNEIDAMIKYTRLKQKREQEDVSRYVSQQKGTKY